MYFWRTRYWVYPRAISCIYCRYMINFGYPQDNLWITSGIRILLDICILCTFLLTGLRLSEHLIGWFEMCKNTPCFRSSMAYGVDSTAPILNVTLKTVIWVCVTYNVTYTLMNFLRVQAKSRIRAWTWNLSCTEKENNLEYSFGGRLCKLRSIELRVDSCWGGVV